MNRLIHLLFPVALGLASGAAADLVKAGADPDKVVEALTGKEAASK